MTKIVWNDCDGYIETSEKSLYHGSLEFPAFEVTEIDRKILPEDEDGDLDLTGIYVTESGKFYR